MTKDIPFEKNNKLKQCTICNIDYYPKFMWINHSNNHTNKKNIKKEHLTALCGGCKKNNCKYIRLKYPIIR